MSTWLNQDDINKLVNDTIDYLKNETLDKRTKIYLGCDSQVISIDEKKKLARYCTVVVIHKNGKNGCKIIYSLDEETIYDEIKKPTMRILNEVYKVSEAYLALKEKLEYEIEMEVHLDINSEKGAGSNYLVGQAAGYIKGMCQVDPKLKPQAFAASKAADHLVH